MNIVPEWLPNLHPLVVHFPIALLLTAVLVDLASLFWRNQTWIKRSALLLYVLGTVAAIGTYFSGQQAADSVTIPDLANPTLNEHADLALYTTWFFGVYTLVRLILVRTGIARSKAVEAVLWLVAAAGLILLFETAEHGGELVFRFGVGTLPASARETVPTPTGAAESPRALQKLGSGNWQWVASPAAAGSFGRDFHWLKGDPEKLKPQPVLRESGEYGLRLALAGDTLLFVVPDTLASISLEVEVNLDRLEGTLRLVHHLQDENTYHFLQVSPEGTVLGRVVNGQTTVLDQKRAPVQGWLVAKTVGDGRHFRGYLNGKLLLHGHADPLPPGRAGLAIQGRGEVFISRLKLTNLKSESNHAAMQH